MLQPFVSATIIFLLLLSSCEESQNGNIKNEDHSAVLPEEKSNYPELYQLILEKDSLLFEVGFNQIDTNQFVALIAKDFEFYHDEHGITDSKQAFITSIARLSDLPFKTWRTLKKESVEVFPLYSDDKTQLYGILQTGIHDFYQQLEGEEAQKTSTAKFSHLWILEEDEWKLKRVLSYDHRNSI